MTDRATPLSGNRLARFDGWAVVHVPLWWWVGSWLIWDIPWMLVDLWNMDDDGFEERA